MLEQLPFFCFDGTSSRDEQLVIQEKNTYTGAARDVTFQSVPGRSGDLLIDNKRFKNVKVQYTVAAIEGVHDIPAIAHRVKGWLSSKVGYFKLVDSYDPRYYRMAAYTDAFDLEQELPCLGHATVAFNCKPFRYLQEGEQAITLTSAQTICNPEAFAAKPYIKITGSGAIILKIKNRNYGFINVDGYIEIDSEIMNAFKGTTNENSKMVTSVFPELDPGENNISWFGSVSSVEIIPRWCCL